MRRWVTLISVLSVALAACNMAGPAGTRRPAAKSSVKPTAKVSPKPGAPSPGASRKPALLEGPTALVKGTLEIDAHYIVSNNAGSLISNAGGSAIALKGGKLISDNGLGLISDNGLGLISDNGLGIIANNGGGLISDNGLGFRVLQAASAVKVGTVLPVKGMVVFPVSLRTGEIVGKPVFTDDQGGYQLLVPEAVKGNLRLVARVPVAKADDPIAKDLRAQYNLVVEAAPELKETRVFDEDTSVGTRYLRASFTTRLRELITAEDPDKAASTLVRALGFDAGLKQFLSGTVLELNKAAKDAGVLTMAPEKVDALAERLTDILLSYVPVYTIEIDPTKYGKSGPKEPAFLGMVDVMRQVRLAAAATMEKNPKAFDNAAWMQGAPLPRTIKKPTDLCDFIVDNFLQGLSSESERTEAAFMEAGVAEPVALRRRMNALAIGLLANVGQTLLTVPESKTEMLTAIKASSK